MGLDVSHDAWSGAYASFSRFREELARAAGGRTKDVGFARMEWTYDTDVLPPEHVAGFSVLMNHSDCDGDISPEDCPSVAAALEWIAPRLPDYGTGHLARLGCRGAALQFAAGCRKAAEAGEPLEFH